MTNNIFGNFEVKVIVSQRPHSTQISKENQVLISYNYSLTQWPLEGWRAHDSSDRTSTQYPISHNPHPL